VVIGAQLSGRRVSPSGFVSPQQLAAHSAISGMITCVPLRTSAATQPLHD
jgi:hypothetical protein